MIILVACETSGEVRRAFANMGHDVVSCDLLPADDGIDYVRSPHGKGYMRHYMGDALGMLKYHDWDLMLAFPPCTDIDFFLALAYARTPKICIENPVGIMSTHYREPDQIIQPWQFGHGETEATCLWLKGLDKLEPTHVVSPTGWKERSKTYSGIAQAMADQWGK